MISRTCSAASQNPVQVPSVNAVSQMPSHRMTPSSRGSSLVRPELTSASSRQAFSQSGLKSGARQTAHSSHAGFARAWQDGHFMFCATDIYATPRCNGPATDVLHGSATKSNVANSCNSLFDKTDKGFSVFVARITSATLQGANRATSRCCAATTCATGMQHGLVISPPSGGHSRFSS